MRAVILLGGPNKGTRFRPLSLVWVFDLVRILSRDPWTRTVQQSLLDQVQSKSKTLIRHSKATFSCWWHSNYSATGTNKFYFRWLENSVIDIGKVV